MQMVKYRSLLLEAGLFLLVGDKPNFLAFYEERPHKGMFIVVQNNQIAAFFSPEKVQLAIAKYEELSGKKLDTAEVKTIQTNLDKLYKKDATIKEGGLKDLATNLIKVVVPIPFIKDIAARVIPNAVASKFASAFPAIPDAELMRMGNQVGGMFTKGTIKPQKL